MDWLTFAAELIKALAWPLTILLVFVVLRKPILNLLPTIGRLKFKDFELDFGRRLEEAAAEAAALDGNKSGQPPAPPADEQLLRMAEISPRAAIIEAWIRVETAAVDAARRKNVSILSSQLRSPHQLIQILEESGVIDARQAAVFHDLRGLRNSAAHATDFRPSTEAAVEYLRIASKLEQSLQKS